MNDAFVKIIYETEREFNNALEKWNSFSKRKEKTRKMLTEAYGSFPGQFESVESVAEKIYDAHYINAENNIWNIDLRENISGVGNVWFVSRWHNSPSPYETPVRAAKQKNDGKTVIVIDIYGEGVVPYELKSTIAHEIMRCFQSALPKIKGINEKSMILYRYLPQFFNLAPSKFSQMFFYGLYICYHIETSANISSISNFMAGYFKGRQKEEISTEEYQKALHKCDKYRIYENVLDVLTKLQPQEEDKTYIKKKMTSEFLNFFKNNEPIHLYYKKTFDVDNFIEKNVKNIIKICKETVNRMQKNIVVFKERGN